MEKSNKVNCPDEQKEILSIIKSCINSVQDKLTVLELQRDYMQIVGSPIPFKKYNHATLESFLQAFPESIRLTNHNGKLCVEAVPDSSTAHVVKLVRNQKRSHTRGRGFRAPSVQVRRPMNTTPWRPPQPSYRGRRPFPPNQGYRMGINRPVPLLAVPPLNRPKIFNVAINAFAPKSPPKNIIPKQVGYFPNSNKSEVEKIAKERGLNPPRFEISPMGKKHNVYICKLTIGEHSFSTYPYGGRNTEEEAIELACKIALSSLKGTESSILQETKETKNFHEASQRIIQILKRDTSRPLWWSYVKDVYKKEFNECIPETWVEEAKGRVPDIQIDNPVSNRYTLQLKLTNNIPKSTPNSPGAKRYNTEKPDHLKLPDDNMWNVFISYIKDCSEIWFRLIDDEYSSVFEEFQTQVELHYFDEKNRRPVKNLVIDGYYICHHEDSWFRIRLVSIEGNMATVFFIDHGDTETLESSKLFYLEKEFLKFPSQSINACLCGFEFGFNDPAIHSELQNLALGKTLVAEVLSREENISVVLYDTSTADDININEQLMQMLPNAYPTPTFPSMGGICEAYVSHVTAEGDIYINFESATYKILDSLFHTAKNRAIEILGSEALSIDMGKLYLAKFSSDGEWHRAAPRSLNRDTDGKCLPCRLHNVPSKPGLHWTPKASERLISMLPSKNEPLLLKVVKEGKDRQLTEVELEGKDRQLTEVELERKDRQLTEVELFTRVHPQNLLVSIATTLDMAEPSLFRSEDNNNNCHAIENKKSSVSFASNGMAKKKLVSPDSSTGELLDVFQIIAPPLPEIRSYFDVVITNAASPFNFAVQSWKDAVKFKWLMGEMSTHYSNPSNYKKVEDLKEGGYYAFHHTDNDWYRVRIDKIMGDFISGTFIDCGDVFCSNTELSRKVQTLLQNFKQLPYQAFKAKLGGIVPINKDWTPEDSCRFRELVENRPFVSIVTNVISASKNSDPPTLVLRLIDTQDPKLDKYIDDVLISENRAQKEN